MFDKYQNLCHVKMVVNKCFVNGNINKCVSFLKQRAIITILCMLGVNLVDHVNPNRYFASQLGFLAQVLLIIVILRVVELVKHTRFYSR